MKLKLFFLSVIALSAQALALPTSRCNVLANNSDTICIDGMDCRYGESVVDVTINGAISNYLSNYLGYNITQKGFRMGPHIQATKLVGRFSPGTNIDKVNRIYYSVRYMGRFGGVVDLGFNDLLLKDVPTCDQIQAAIQSRRL